MTPEGAFHDGCWSVPGAPWNMSDITFLVDYLFKSGSTPPCPPEGDADASGSVNVSDLTYLVNYLFKGG